MENFHSGLVTLCSTFVLVLVFSDLLWSELGMDVHKFKDFGANFIILFQFYLPKHLNVLVAPSFLFFVVHRFGLTEQSLHGANNILCNLTHLNCSF